MADNFETSVESVYGGIRCGYQNGKWWLRVVVVGPVQGTTQTKTISGPTIEDVFFQLNESRNVTLGDSVFIGPAPAGYDNWKEFIDSKAKVGAVVLSRNHYIRELGALKSHLDDDSPFLKEALGDFLKEFL